MLQYCSEKKNSISQCILIKLIHASRSGKDPVDPVKLIGCFKNCSNYSTKLYCRSETMMTILCQIYYSYECYITRTECNVRKTDCELVQAQWESPFLP